MSFIDKNDLFLEPKTTQYGSHMIMTNVNKPTRNKLINFDTRFRDEYNYNDDSYYNVTIPDRYKYNITLPERITNAKTLTIKSIEIPMTFYNISANLGNNSFNIYNITINKNCNIIIPDGYYNSITSIITAVQIQLTAIVGIGSGGTTNVIIQQNSNGNVELISNCPASGADGGTGNTNFFYTVTFSTTDKYNFKSSLGWILGYRNPVYNFNSINAAWNTNIPSTQVFLANQLVVAEQPSLLTVPAFPKYLYLSIDEYNKSVQNSFITPLSNAFINKNVVARITIDQNTYGYGSVLVANIYNGLLVSDVRNYNGKVDLQKFNIQLFNETGMPIDLNGQDFSFLTETTYE